MSSNPGAPLLSVLFSIPPVAFNLVPIVNPWKSPNGAGKFESAYAWPFISLGVVKIQFNSTLVGATSPWNIMEVREEQSANA